MGMVGRRAWWGCVGLVCGIEKACVGWCMGKQCVVVGREHAVGAGAVGAAVRPAQ